MGRIRVSGLDEAFAAAADGVFAATTAGRIVLWNRAAERIMGYGVDEAMGRPCCDIFLGLDDMGNRLCYRGCHIMTLVKMHEPVESFDMLTRTKAGRPIWLNLNTLVVPGEHGHGDLVVHLFRDVTAAKALLSMVRERLTEGGAAGGSRDAVPLTQRELEVLRLLAAGTGTKALADALHVSPATVRNHVQNLLGKLGVHSRLEAVAYATRHRLL